MGVDSPFSEMDIITAHIKGTDAFGSGLTKEEALGELVLRNARWFFYQAELGRMVLSNLEGFGVEILPDNPILSNAPYHNGERVLEPDPIEPWILK